MSENACPAARTPRCQPELILLESGSILQELALLRWVGRGDLFRDASARLAHLPNRRGAPMSLFADNWSSAYQE